MKKFVIFTLFSSVLFGDFGIRSQVELHTKYQDLDRHLHDVMIYPRLEGAYKLPKRWQLYTRLDVPYLWLWGKKKINISIDESGLLSISKPKKKMVEMKVPLREQGLGDTLTRAFFVTPPLDKNERIVVGFGSELIFPTAQEHDLGSGKYAARPMVGFRYDLPQIGKGSGMAFLCKYGFSFAGNKHREPFQIFYLQPVFEYVFAPSWVFTFAPEYQYNVRTKKWFVPLSLTVTKSFTNHFSTTITYQKGLVTDFYVFSQEVEWILRYSF